MRTAHIKPKPGSSHPWLMLILLVLICLTLTACSGNPLATVEPISVTIQDLQEVHQLTVPAGSNVQSALDKAEIVLRELDRVEPPTYTVIDETIAIQVIRVTEEFEVEEKVMPYLRQTVRNESLAEGEQLLVQPGVNGLQQLTYRSVLENGIETSRSLFKTTISVEPQSEIIMIGVQSPFKPIEIPGRMVYLTAGNAWLMEDDTGTRIPLITSGDLDGRIFNLSPDGKWLLFTRLAEEGSGIINSLWLLNLDNRDTEPVNLQIDNVIHFADWAPNTPQMIFYSTVEPRSTAPGWQANNNLLSVVIGSDGLILSQEEVVEPNSGGIYGWWGTHFLWAPDGSQLAYARPDSVGLVDFENNIYYPLVDILPFQTRSDWAWVPGLSWSADSQLLYVVTHEKSTDSTNHEASPIFNLSTVSLSTLKVFPLVQQVGMFAQPQFSPAFQSEPLRIAYLEAIFPEQSDTSHYRLITIDQDGSNRKEIFPSEGSLGLEPQVVAWSPSRLNGQPRYLGYIYQGNIWLIDSETAKFQQVTGDGLISRMDWQ